jgi:hypothetical protein
MLAQSTTEDTMTKQHIEWLLEELVDGSEDADIHDVSHADSYAGIMALAKGCEHCRIGLVIDKWNAALMSDDRGWAYIVDGKLPERFTDAGGVEMVKVPAKYHNELARANA